MTKDMAQLQKLGDERTALLERLEEIRAAADPIIVRMSEQGVEQRSLAANYGVTRDAIRLIVKKAEAARKAAEAR